MVDIRTPVMSIKYFFTIRPYFIGFFEGCENLIFNIRFAFVLWGRIFRRWFFMEVLRLNGTSSVIQNSNTCSNVEYSNTLQHTIASLSKEHTTMSV